MEKTPDYVAHQTRDPRNPPDKDEKRTEKRNARSEGKQREQEGEEAP